MALPVLVLPSILRMVSNGITYEIVPITVVQISANNLTPLCYSEKIFIRLLLGYEYRAESGDIRASSKRAGIRKVKTSRGK